MQAACALLDDKAYTFNCLAFHATGVLVPLGNAQQSRRKLLACDIADSGTGGSGSCPPEAGHTEPADTTEDMPNARSNDYNKKMPMPAWSRVPGLACPLRTQQVLHVLGCSLVKFVT